LPHLPVIDLIQYVLELAASAFSVSMAITETACASTTTHESILFLISFLFPFYSINAYISLLWIFQILIAYSTIYIHFAGNPESIILMLTPASARAVNSLAETPGVNDMPHPTVAISAMSSKISMVSVSAVVQIIHYVIQFSVDIFL
jgi:hypothetical protein